MAALLAALSALAHCVRGQVLDHWAEARGRPLAKAEYEAGYEADYEAECPPQLGRGSVWAAVLDVAVLGSALRTGLCHDSWGQARDLAVMV